MFISSAIQSDHAADQSTQYVPYIHVNTGERALVPARYDSINGVLVPIVPTPTGFVSALHRPAQPSFISSIISSITHCCENIAKLVTPSSTCVDATNPMHSTRVSPVSIRQPIFPDEDDADATHQSVQPKLSTKSLEALSTALELENIEAWLVDFTTAIGRVDQRAHMLLHTSDWRLLTGLDGPAWALAANKRIADAIHAALDPNGANVKLLKTALREAEGEDRPGVLYSGMDILDEIRALVTERSYGEIRLDKETAKIATFTLGSSRTPSSATSSFVLHKNVLFPMHSCTISSRRCRSPRQLSS